MIKIYHNPRCKKSREGIEALQRSGKDFEVVKYLEKVPSRAELREILDCLAIKPEKLVRKNEKIWKEKYRGKLMTDEEILEAMIAHPTLIERPVVLKGNKAVIGRPVENIVAFLKDS